MTPGRPNGRQRGGSGSAPSKRQNGRLWGGYFCVICPPSPPVSTPWNSTDNTYYYSYVICKELYGHPLCFARTGVDSHPSSCSSNISHDPFAERLEAYLIDTHPIIIISLTTLRPASKVPTEYGHVYICHIYRERTLHVQPVLPRARMHLRSSFLASRDSMLCSSTRNTSS